MKYYKAREQDGLVVFDCWWQTDQDLIRANLYKTEEKEETVQIDEDGTEVKQTITVPVEPLQPIEGIFTEEDIPAKMYNIYPVVLQDDGTVREMTEAELQPHKDAYEREQLREQVEEIDRETKAEIAKGFTFDGQTFSLSANAQANWQGLLGMHNAGIFTDQDISTLDDGIYHLTSDKLTDFISAGATAIQTAIAQGRSKKQDLLNPV